jgi:hypothetical protein
METTQLKPAAEVAPRGFDHTPLMIALTLVMLALAITLGFVLAHAIETRWVFVR